jgi:hypothetical protein
MSHHSITKFLDPKEDSLSDMDFYIFDSVLYVSNLYQFKYQIVEEPRSQQDNFNLVESCIV